MKYNPERIKKMRQNIKLFKEENKMVIKNNLEPVPFSDQIDWGYEHPHNANTYQTYLHCLNPVVDFLAIAEEDGDETLVQDAKRLIMDWYENGQDTGTHCWAEHAVSYRIINIILFQNRGGEYKLDDFIFDQIVEIHCSYLSEEKNYKMNNHGLMMDNALLKASYYIKDEQLKSLYTDKALYRIRFAFFRDISRKGVHLENSPEYQRLTLALYRSISKTLKETGQDLGRDIKLLFEKVNDFREYIIKPNNEYPMLGDTGQIEEGNIKKNYKDFLDKEAGIAILQYKNKKDPAKSTYMTFNCGYQRVTHKHHDDLSVTLYLDGHDVLIDSGKYSYDKNDEIRQFMTSPDGHSTLGIKNMTYQFTNPFEDQFNLTINKFTSTKDYKIISGMNNLYRGCTLSRTVILTREGVLIMIDRMSSGKNQNVYQNFPINEQAVISKISDLEYNINIGEYDYIMETYQLRRPPITSSVEEGHISKKFGKAVENERITFSMETDKASFVTALYNKTHTVENVRFANNRLDFSLNGKEHNIQI